MNAFLSPSPVVLVLLKWTALLALAWTAHLLLRNRHCRWRLILWRSILCFGLVLPLLCVFPVPVFQIPIPVGSSTAPSVPEQIAPAATGSSNPKDTSPSPSLDQPVVAPTAAKNSPPVSSSSSLEPWLWKKYLLIIWVVGVVVAGSRLVLIQIQLSRLRGGASQTSPDLHALVQEVRARLGVRRTIQARVSNSVGSPFICGLFRPMLILPEKLARELSSRQLTTLLSHELAHFRHHDLAWSIGWRWMQAACWFHPLVWRVPAAHNLACEEEADRFASGQFEERGIYAQLLAQLALSVLALPNVETQLTVNGTSQIAQRLRYITDGSMSGWTWRRSLAAFGFAAALFLMAAGCEVTATNASASKTLVATEFKEAPVVVQDEDGRPIEGATITPFGFRVKGLHGADAYNYGMWRHLGLPNKVTTDRDGKAYVRYPVMGIPEEKEYTGELIFSVMHPEYSKVTMQEYPVEGTNNPIRMKHGIPLEVSGYFGADHQPVTDLAPNVSDGDGHWQKKENGIYLFRRLSPGGHLVQLMGRLPSEEIVYSDAFPFSAEPGKQYTFALELKPGIRLEGRLDDNVPRPVSNGLVLISVRPKEFPIMPDMDSFYDLRKQYGDFGFWQTYRPIAADGTFVFESIPPGELDVAVLGDGFVSKSIWGIQKPLHGFGVPQPFPLVRPVTKIEVVTEPTATLSVSAKSESGKPVDGATILVSPNVLRMSGFLVWKIHSSEEPFRALPPRHPAFSATTDKSGTAVIRNLPAFTNSLEVEHPHLTVPLQDPNGWRNRLVRLKLSPGATTNVVLTLEAKGKEFIDSGD